MGKEYTKAIDMFVEEQRVFINALKSVDNQDKVIVIHGTGSPNGPPTPQEVAMYFASNKDMVSSHFIIGTDGTIVQCVSLNDGAAANCCLEVNHDKFWDEYANKYKNLNYNTISIEHCNNVDNSLLPTKAQLDASIELVRWLRTKYEIDGTRIKTHASLDPDSRKNCPGNFPMEQLINDSAPIPVPIPKKKTIKDVQVELQQVQNELTQIQSDIIQINQPTVI